MILPLKTPLPCPLSISGSASDPPPPSPRLSPPSPPSASVRHLDRGPSHPDSVAASRIHHHLHRPRPRLFVLFSLCSFGSGSSFAPASLHPRCPSAPPPHRLRPPPSALSSGLRLCLASLLSRSSLSVRPVRHRRRPLRLSHPPRQPPPPASSPPPAAPLYLNALRLGPDSVQAAAARLAPDSIQATVPCLALDSIKAAAARLAHVPPWSG